MRNTLRIVPSGEQAPDHFPIGLSILALLLSIGLYSFLHSPYFHITTVTVQGNNVVTEEELMTLAAIFPGDNVLQVDLRKLAGRVASHPRVRHVHINRRLPDTLIIVMQEHVPVAFVPVADGAGTESADGNEPEFVAVNDVGTAVPLVGDEGNELPVITAVEPEMVAAAVATAAHMPVPLRSRVETIDVERLDNELYITARTRSGGTVLFGDDQGLDRKAAIASSLLETTDYAVVDVRFPRLPTVRVR